MRFLPVFLDLQAGPVLLVGAGDLARAKLRLLADETPAQGDQELYREAADALEKRAAWLSGTLPDMRCDPAPDRTPQMHRPVNLVV